MEVMGKGSIGLEIGGIKQVISKVYFIPELKNNLLSMGQCQEKGIDILILGRRVQVISSTKWSHDDNENDQQSDVCAFRNCFTKHILETTYSIMLSNYHKRCFSPMVLQVRSFELQKFTM